MADWTIDNDGSVTSPRGFRAGVVAAGIKKPGRLDLALIVADRPCQAAALFTRNQIVAAPVTLSRQVLARRAAGARGLVVNSGNANACTGPQGAAAAAAMQQAAAAAVGCDPQEMFVMSTGVIGVQLPLEKISAGIAAAGQVLDAGAGVDAARAIMTTDTVPKHLALMLETAVGRVTIGGMAKGAGMIHPDMATLLVLVTSDAGLPAGSAQTLWQTAVQRSFNQISVDGDTSTNDTALFLASGAGPTLSAADLPRFQAALNEVCLRLAQAVIRDAEGATKFVELRVSGMAGDEDAQAVGRTVATSPLVKTALAGSDANWGRILAAAGRAGVPLDMDRTALRISGDGETWLQLVAGGVPTDYREEDAAAIFSAGDIWIHLDGGGGPGAATLWTCDLGHDYVSINADYRT